MVKVSGQRTPAAWRELEEAHLGPGGLCLLDARVDELFGSLDVEAIGDDACF